MARQAGIGVAISVNEDQRRTEKVRLLAAIKDALPRLEQMWQQVDSHWGYEDPG